MQRDSAPPARNGKTGTTAGDPGPVGQVRQGPEGPAPAAAKTAATQPRASADHRTHRSDHAARHQVTSEVSFQQWWMNARAAAPARPPEVSASERRDALRSRLELKFRAVSRAQEFSGEPGPVGQEQQGPEGPLRRAG